MSRVDDAVIDAAARALGDDMLALFVGSARGGWFRHAAGASAAFTGSSVPTLNGVYSWARETDVDLVDRLLDDVAATGARYSLQSRPDDGRLAVLAERRGMAAVAHPPLLLLTDDRVVRELVGASELPVRRLAAGEVDVHLDTSVRGFDMPADSMAPWAGGDLLAAPEVAAYVAELDGEPVATALGLRSGEHVGVFSVTTLPAYRRRGLGALLTARAVVDALAAGARVALLQSSPIGLAVYERLGFVRVEDWTVYLPREYAST